MTVNTIAGGFSAPRGVALDAAGNLFVADSSNNAVKKIPAAGGYVSVSTLGSGFTGPTGVAVDGSGNVYVADAGNAAVKVISAASGYTVVRTLGGGFGTPTGVAVDSSGNVFVADTRNNVVNEILSGGPAIPLLAAVLPESRSVQIGATATAFATLVNAGASTALGCTIAPLSTVAATFAFQTTDPTTNAVTGTQNAAVSIPASGSQSFVVAFKPTAPFAPTDVVLTFGCPNAGTAPTTVGVNTLNLSASGPPVPDIVALIASGDPGYVDIPGTTGTGIFAVATVNLGIAAPITVSVDSGAAHLPVLMLVCATNPLTGACFAPPALSVTTTIAANSNPTFGIFVTGNGTVANLPAINRAFVRFTDSDGVLRGQTSVAVRTQ